MNPTMNPDIKNAPWAAQYRDGEAERAQQAAVGESLEQVLSRGCRARTEAPLLTTLLPGGRAATINNEQFERDTAAFGAYLQRILKLTPGTVIAVQAPNCIGYAVAALGALRAGMVLSNVNPLYTAPEAKRQVLDCKAEVLVVCDLFGDRVEAAVDGTSVRHIIMLSVLQSFTTLKRAALDTVLRLKRLKPRVGRPTISMDKALAEGRQTRFDPPEPDLDGDRLYQYSGGTTGISKGVVLTERNLLTNLAQGTSLTGDLLDTEGRTILLVLPLYHMFGLFMCLMGVRFGFHIVLVPNPRPLENLRAGFETFNADVFPGVNTLFAALLREPWFANNPPTLEMTLTGATPLHPDVAARWCDATKSKMVESYGMTESTTVLTSNPPDERFRTGSVGLPLPGTELRIVDSDGATLPPGEPGEILARGPQITRGYLNRPEENEQAWSDGWFHTGDIGYLDADGFLHLVDRKKDMIIVGGFNVYPNEIEAVLNEHPDVVESGVIGVADEDGAETVTAFVVCGGQTPAPDTLINWCRQSLTRYKCPKRIVFIDEIPKTPVGKVLRRELREHSDGPANALHGDPS
ncbi:MAG: AMP-binding protein [Pseudomonadota bacterium]